MLSLLERGRARARMPRTLILEPTRELAAQVEEAFAKYGANHKLNVALLIGGVSFGDQEAKIARGADVVIATPGRLLDFTERGDLLLTGIEILVIDEADRMLDMGFIPDIERICKLVPFTRQTLFFSATMPPEITRLMDTFLHNPVRVEVARAATTAENITQTLIPSGSAPHDKRATLRRSSAAPRTSRTPSSSATASATCRSCTARLQKHGFSVGALHGDLDQRARMAALDAFRSDQLQLLVCSDVAARGLDIPDVSHVINYDPPHHAEDYVHRIGRTGRAGKMGAAFTIVSRADARAIAEIEKLIARKIEWQQGAEMPAEDEAEPDTRRRSSRRGESRRGARAADEPRPDHHTERRSESRHHRASRPTQERATVEEEHASTRHGARTEDEPRPDRHAERRSESRHHHAPRPPQERAAVEEERASTRRAARFGEPARRREPSRPDIEPPVIGLGDHIPSFLLRPVPKRSRLPREQAAVEE